MSKWISCKQNLIENKIDQRKVPTSLTFIHMMASRCHCDNPTMLNVDVFCWGLDTGDRQALEQKYRNTEPPCLLDSSDGRWERVRETNIYHSCFQCVVRFVLKGVSYNPMDVMNCLMIRRGYKMQGNPQQRSLPNVHNKDDKWGTVAVWCICVCREAGVMFRNVEPQVSILY